jgi:uncharacterized protein YgiM (DUF1202 family)
MKKYIWILAALCGAGFLLAAEESATVNRARVNVRGGPSLVSEVITQLQKGDQVTVLDEIPVEKPKPGEPARWAVIKLPPNTPVWVFTDFLAQKTVKVKRLNLRGGPGENFSVVGRLEKGEQVKEIRSVDNWMEIEAPATARAYVDISYLDRPNAPAKESAPVAAVPEKLNVFEPPAKPAPVVTKTEPPVVKEEPKAVEKAPEPKPVKSDPEPKPAETVVVKEEPVVVPPKEEKPPVTVAAKPEENAAKPAEKAEPAPAPPVEKEPEVARVLPEVGKPVSDGGQVVLGKRIVRREGEVRSTKFNIQAPTYFELTGEKGKMINFLSAEKTGFKLKDYKGLRVVVTGEESIDPRFPERPLLEVETIEVAP